MKTPALSRISTLQKPLFTQSLFFFPQLLFKWEAFSCIVVSWNFTHLFISVPQLSCRDLEVLRARARTQLSLNLKPYGRLGIALFAFCLVSCMLGLEFS